MLFMENIKKIANDNMELAYIAAENISEPCYIADMDTYALLYINKKLRDILGCGDLEYEGRKCYEVLQNKVEPCEFCTNKHLKENEYYIWEHYNDYFKRYYVLKDIMFLRGKQRLRLEIANDITSFKSKYTKLEEQITMEQTLVNCANTLSIEDDIPAAINKILSIIGKHYNANRAYIFEPYDDSKKSVSNTYEWCSDRISPQISALQEIPISILPEWIEKFEKDGVLFIDSLTEDLDKDSADYRILDMQGIESLIAVPLIKNGELCGFIGVDDPTINRNDVKTLQTVSAFLLDDLNKMKVAQKLEFLNNRDKLTGLHNRYNYENELQEIKEKQIKSIGIIHVDINGLKKINDKFGNSFGDHYIVNCAIVLKQHFEDCVFRIGSDEFMILLKDMKKKDFDKKVQEFENARKENKQISVSVGACWCDSFTDIDNHIKTADMLMLQDKEIYNKSIKHSIEYIRGSAIDILQNDINNGEYQVMLQPKILLATNEVIGAEALVYNIDKRGEYIPISQFITVCESQGTVHLINLFVLEKICQVLSRLCEDKSILPNISLNFSRGTILYPNIEILCKEVCNRYSIDPAMITIEVTENSGFMKSVELSEALNKIRNIGFKIALADFGYQYSIIEIVNSIAFDEIKLSKSLLRNVTDNSAKSIALEHLIKMYQAIPNITLVIKGIEDESHLEILDFSKDLVGQGDLLSKPLGIDAFLKLKFS